MSTRSIISWMLASVVGACSSACGDGGATSAETSFVEIARSVVALRELNWLDALDLRLPTTSEGAEKRRWLCGALFDGRADPPVLSMLQRFSVRHPERIDLAGFRAGGVDYLIGILEDSKADPWRPRLAAREIGFHGTRVAADRIAALAQDTTIVDNGSKIEFDSERSIEVLGAFVRDAIHQIHERETR